MSVIAKLIKLKDIAITVADLPLDRNAHLTYSPVATVGVFKAIDLIREYQLVIDIFQKAQNTIQTQLDILDTPDVPDTIEMETQIASNRKLHDASRWTQYQYDFIKKGFDDFNTWNLFHPEKRKTQEELRDMLNSRLNLDKSKGAYSTIWHNKVDRSTLSLGTPIK